MPATRHCGRFFKTFHAVMSEARASSSSVQGACDGAAEKAEALDRLPAQEGADAGIAVLVGLSGSALGLLRYGFAIASPRNDAIPNDSRDGHLPCEKSRKSASDMHWKLIILYVQLKQNT